MSVNLVSMIQETLGGSAMGQISKLLGENEATTSKAVGTAVPTILAGLMKQASSPDGLKSLGGMLNQADPKMLDNLGGMLSGGGATNMMAQGGDWLKSIFGGGNMLGGIFDTITKASGMGKTSVMSLMGLLLPIVLGVLGKIKNMKGLDLAGLAGMLMGQKNILAGMLPSGVGDMLGFANLGSAATAAMGQIGGAAGQMANQAGYAAQQAAAGGGSLLGKLIPLALVAAVAWFGYNYFIKNKAAVPALPAIPAELKSLTDGLPGTFEKLTSSLGGIKDVESAKAALPNLESLATNFSSLSKGMATLPDALKSTVKNTVNAQMPAVEKKITEILGLEGLPEPVKAVLNTIISKLKALIG